MTLRSLLSAVALLSAAARPAGAADLVLADQGRSDYQVVLPKEIADPVIDRALGDVARVVREMFRANGCAVPVVREGQADPGKPGIYLGGTAVARAAGVEETALPVWHAVWQVAGKNVIIAGRDGAVARRPDGTTPRSLGTVKGTTEFLRRYCGTRFLAPGGLTGIEFLPTARIAVPGDLDRRLAPRLLYNAGGRPVTDVALVALNFLDRVTAEHFGHTHEIAVPAEKFADSHPEYFALVNGRRAREVEHPEKKGLTVREPHLCYANRDVQELIYQAMLRSFDAGYTEYPSLQADGFQPCQCEECHKLFGTPDWGEKLWQLNRGWAERLHKDRPGKTLVVTAYTVTEKPPSFKDFPPNLRVDARSTPEALAQWEGYTIPAGFSTYLHAWGGYHLCGYLPVRTPLFAEKTVRLFDARRVQGVGLDSPPANMWGLEGPTVYVYGRMLDDVAAGSAGILVEEYVQAAYGPAAPAMSAFFQELHHTLEAYAEVFGVDNGTFQTYRRADGRTVRYLTWQGKLRLIGFLYPPETLALLEGHLAQAERTAGPGDKVKLRLALARREFDYLRGTARVVHLYHAYQTRRDRVSLEGLLSEMEAREKMILSWYDTAREYRPGTYLQRPIAPEWRMFLGSGGHYNTHLVANGGSYLSQPVPPFTWNVAEVRRAPLLAPPKMTAKRVPAPLTLADAAWERIPGAKLGPCPLGSPAPRWAGEVKAAHDAQALYVRFSGGLPAGWDRPPALRRDHPDIPRGESFSVVLAPDRNAARYYRLAGGVTPEACYDARRGFVEDAIDPRFDRDDTAWDPDWRYECAVAGDGRGWSALLVIPFASLPGTAPAAGAEWRVNFGRVHQLRRQAPAEVALWSANPDTTSVEDRNAFGLLVLE